MKKYLLGALFILGTISYAAGNKKIVTVNPNGTAEAKVLISVTGRIVDPIALSLVVEPKSALTSNGVGFAFVMPDMFAGTVGTETLRGEFDVYLTKKTTPTGPETRVVFTKDLQIRLAKGASVYSTVVTNSNVVPGVTLEYTLVNSNTNATGTGNGYGTANSLGHTGKIDVKATTTTSATAGTYTDTSVELKVNLTGQTMTP